MAQVARTLWDVLGAIVDRRGAKGRQLPLAGILAIAIAAMLAGANDLRAIFRWGRRLTPEAAGAVRHRPGTLSCHISLCFQIVGR